MVQQQISGLTHGFLLEPYTNPSPENLLYSCGLNKETPSLLVYRVASNWIWPRGRKVTAEVKRLQQATPRHFVLVIESPDEVFRRGGSSGVYTVKSAIKLLRTSAVRSRMETTSLGKRTRARILVYSMATM